MEKQLLGLLNAIDNEIQGLKQLSVPYGYSDFYFAYVLTSFNYIKDNFESYEKDPLLQETLQLTLQLVNEQHKKLHRDAEIWQKEYMEKLYSKYDSFIKELTFR